MQNPVSRYLKRRRKNRRDLRDARKAMQALKGGIRAPVYVGNNTVLAPTHYGQWIYLATEDTSVCPRILTTGMWEAGTTAFIQAHVRDGMNYVEVGANYGYFALQAGVLVGDNGRVDAFEPLPRAHQLMARSFLANGAAKRCFAHPHAVTERAGSATLHLAGDDHGGGRLVPRDPGEERTAVSFDVQTLPLDEALEGRTVDFLKIDAEGGEGHVLAGASETLGRNPNIVMVLELRVSGWRRMGCDALEVFESLAHEGLQFWRIDEMSGSLTAASPASLVEDPEALFDLVCARNLPQPRPGYPSFLA